MKTTEFEIAPFVMPTDVAELRKSKAAKRLLKLYAGITRQHYDIDSDDDIDIIDPMLKINATRTIQVAYKPGDINKVRGFISYNESDEASYLHVHHLAVRKRHRKQGIGSALLDAVQNEAEILGLESVTLLSVPEKVDFYKRRGFKKTSWYDIEMRRNTSHAPAEKTTGSMGRLATIMSHVRSMLGAEILPN